MSGKNCQVLQVPPPLYPTPSSVRGFVIYSTLGHVGDGNRCGGYTLLRVTTPYCKLVNGTLVYRNQGGKYMLKDAWHWSSDSSFVNDPSWNQVAPHCM